MADIVTASQHNAPTDKAHGHDEQHMCEGVIINLG